MSKTFVLVLLLLAIAFCFTEARPARRGTLGKAFNTRKCRKWQNVQCRYVKRCVKPILKCVRSKSVRKCAKYGAVRKTKRVRYCKKVGRGSSKKCFRCTKYGWKTVTRSVKSAKCLRYVRRSVCLKHTTLCKRAKAVKRCVIREPKFRVRGPKKCRKGSTLTFVKKGKTITRKCVKKVRKYTMKQCQSYLDPHTKGFNGKNFEFQFEGDALMAKTGDGVFEVHQRNKRFGGYTGTIGFAARVNGRDVVEFLTPGTFLLNAHAVTLKDKQPLHLRFGGYVVKKGNTIEVFSPNGANLAYHYYANKQGNLYVNVPSDLRVTGYCTGRNVAFYGKNPVSGLFRHRMHVKTVALPKIKWTRRQRRNATVRCKAAGLRGLRFKQCLKDFKLIGGKPGAKKRLLRILKNVRKNGRKFKKLRIRRAWKKLAVVRRF